NFPVYHQIQRNSFSHHQNSPGFYSATTTPFIGAIGDDFSTPITGIKNFQFLSGSPSLGTPTSPSLNRFDLHQNPPVVPSQQLGVSARKSGPNSHSLTENLIISPDLIYSPSIPHIPETQLDLGSSSATDSNNFFAPLSLTSPRIDQTPSYSSDILTEPSTAVNTPYTAPLAYLEENTNVEQSASNKAKRSKNFTFADLDCITTNMASVSTFPPIDKSKSSTEPAESSTNSTNNNYNNGQDVDLSAMEDARVGSPKTPQTPAINTLHPDQAAPRPVPIRPRPDEGQQNKEAPRKRRKSDSGSMEVDGDSELDETNGKNFVCTKCGRGFQRKFNMQTHEQTHDPNRIKPFSCDFPGCGSRFTRKHDLKRHVNGIHKGERVHECNVCNKQFSRKDAWKRHQSSCSKN
ncbi:2455_t:CDS:1, partial [Ambispora leptoticha]